MFEIERLCDRSVVERALARPKPQSSSNQGFGLPNENIVKFTPGLPPDCEDILKPFCGDERSARALAFEQRVGRDRGSVDDFRFRYRAKSAPRFRNAFKDRRLRLARR